MVETEPTQPVPPSPRPPVDPSAVAPLLTPAISAPQSPSIEKQNNAEVAPQPVSESQNGTTDRQLNVTDALSYLDAVKIQFHDRPDVYNVFLDIMKDFKSQVIDTPGVIQRVASLFHGHPSLIQGFNTFLPVGYRIEVGSDAQSSEVITVTTPSGTMLQSTTTPGITPSIPPPPPAPAPSAPPPESGQLSSDRPPATAPTPSSALGLSNTPKLSGGSIDTPTLDNHERQELGPAMDYVQRIKTRFSNDPDTYKQFLEILSSHKSSENSAEVFQKVEELFKDAPDLSSAFREFLPGASGAQDNDGLGVLKGPSTRTSTPTGEHARAQKRKQPAEQTAAPVSAPAKRRRKVAERDKDKERDAGRATSSRVSKAQHPTSRDPPAFSHYNTIPAPPSPRRSTMAPPLQPMAPVTNFDETQFFARVKAALDSRETYHEFLKLVNLFTQDFIDRARLVRECRSFLGEGELMVQFKEILGWDEAMERAALTKEREELYQPPGRPLTILDRPSREELNIRYGSYRRLPADEINVECSGRDEMCKSVLNDEWVSHPSFSSEDSVFMAHKKNIYEEALHRTEEERHEYDFHIDALVRTIGVLEPLNHKTMAMNPDERSLFRLKPNFGGAGKAVHQRIIKKIYGREPGLEVLQAMQDTPALALPVVLARLKQKEIEWKRAQREWNKIWRAVDASNYARSLDHQGISFKMADKKALTSKAFVAQIEAIMETQMARRAALVDPLFARARPQHQLAFEVEDPDVLRDAVKLVFSYISSSVVRSSVWMRRGRAGSRLGSMVSSVPFFNLAIGTNGLRLRLRLQSQPTRQLSGLSARNNGGGGGGGGGGGNGSGGSLLPANFTGGDLRKSLLKSEQAKSTRGQAQAQANPPLVPSPSPKSSTRASPAPASAPVADNEDSARNDAPSLPIRRSFFTNTWFYTLLRMVEVLYCRLHLMKNIALERMNDSSFESMSSAATPMDLELMQASSGLQDGHGQGQGQRQGQVRITASQYYELMLETCERLFDNQIEQLTFEDQMREMFGLEDAYKIFTIDKLLAVLVKHVQSWEQDPKLEKMAKLLWDERRLENPTVEDHRKFRRQAEEILGPEDNLFRIDWLPESKMITFQLLSKDGSSLDDAEVLSGRWQGYVEGFVSEVETPGVSVLKVRRPFLRRSLPATMSTAVSAVSAGEQSFCARGGLEIKVCVRTYRLFYVSRTEDVLWRIPSNAERERANARFAVRNAARVRWLEKFTFATATGSRGGGNGLDSATATTFE
ncbi:hypothetical protein B0F90DRAFT_1627282 [Multifurca ochricompacta]|uniref:Histone deacetylase interacting domain-containing protein n=1 Tax=Multifurca ochricompacta TaxID=376703 RepID=A0AAD4M7Q3_9AGAM|nr:hypothetical protein B0F90DRAFT_1627282 [Multifurca ochricompacta]